LNTYSFQVVGLHPDQATDSILHFALEKCKSFAIVPCCVFADVMPERRLKVLKSLPAEMWHHEGGDGVRDCFSTAELLSGTGEKKMSDWYLGLMWCLQISNFTYNLTSSYTRLR
jgi:hypothetical protein